MKVIGYRCPNCGAVVYSRARHDLRTCPCGTMSVDGGLDYIRLILYKGNKEIPKRVKLDLHIGRQKLYEDWNKGVDRYGIVQKRNKKGVKP